MLSCGYRCHWILTCREQLAEDGVNMNGRGEGGLTALHLAM